MAVTAATGNGASIDGMNFVVDPQTVQWNYTAKIGTQKTIGGKVIQLLGFNMGDLIVRGQYPARSTMWNQREFLEKIASIADAQVPVLGKPSPKPVRFKWPNQGWDFWVFIKALNQDGASVSIERNEAMFAPTYTLTMFVYEDNGNIIKAVQGSAQVKFLQRITAGMGWTQTDWNGPMTIEEVSASLAGATVWEYLATPLPMTAMNDQGADTFPAINEAHHQDGHPGTETPPATPPAGGAGGAPISGVRITVYSPQAGGDAIEGGYESSRPGLDGKSLVRTLDDVHAGSAAYVTLAGDNDWYYKKYNIPTITYDSYKSGSKVTVTLTNVTAYVHDTGSYFVGKPEGVYDVAVGKNYTNAQMNSQPFAGSGKIQLKPL